MDDLCSDENVLSTLFMLDLLHVEEGLEARSLVFAYVCGGQSAYFAEADVQGSTQG